MRCLYAQQMRQAEQKAGEMGLQPIVLMENAGQAVAREIISRWPRTQIERVMVIAGSGNNGGDGFVAARHLWNAGYDVSIHLLGRTSEIRDLALINLNIVIKMGLPITVILDAQDVVALREELLSRKPKVCVDAIFGIGLTSEVTGIHRQVIEALNDATFPVIAVDIPSGLCPDTGFPLGIAVRAGVTVSFAFPKVGLVLPSGTQYVGKLVVADISLPKAIGDEGWKVNLLEESILEDLPVRPPEAYAGDYGRVLLFAGSPGHSGTAYLAGMAALRTGAGQATLAVARGLCPVYDQRLSEIVVLALGSEGDRIYHEAMLGEALHAAEACDALVVGPGIGHTPEGRAFVLGLIAGVSAPLVLDGDGVDLVAGSNFTFTPPGVMALYEHQLSGLTGLALAAIRADRIAALSVCAARYGSVVVLKGLRSVIVSPAGDVAINPTASNHTASQGLGDVLPGLMATFLAQGLSAFQAACLGVYLHGRASDELSHAMGRGQIAGDLLAWLPVIMRHYRGT